jgi:hypothetical protein
VEVAVPQRPEVDIIDLGVGDLGHARDLGGLVQVVQDALDAGEAVHTHQLLAVEPAVRLAELRVPLVGHLAQALVEHGNPPEG